ncbi:hypothetical protein [Lysobacter sp. A289]
MTWEINPDFAQLPAISVGDIVHLKHSDGFTYVVKAIVSRASADQIDAKVEALFDSFGQGQLTAGEPLELVGTTLTFPPKAVHKVISRGGAA